MLWSFLRAYRVDSAFPNNPPKHACSLLRLRSLFRLLHNSEIHHIQCVASRVKFRRDWPLQSMAANFRSWPGLSTFVHCEFLDQAISHIHPHHFRANWVQNFADRRRLIAKQRYESIAHVAELSAARKIEPIRGRVHRENCGRIRRTVWMRRQDKLGLLLPWRLE